MTWIRGARAAEVEAQSGMRPTLRGGEAGVFQESDGREPGETTHLLGHMRLARVAGLERPRGEEPVARHQPSQAGDPSQHLRAVADGGARAAVQGALAHAK